MRSQSTELAGFVVRRPALAEKSPSRRLNSKLLAKESQRCSISKKSCLKGRIDLRGGLSRTFFGVFVTLANFKLSSIALIASPARARLGLSVTDAWRFSRSVMEPSSCPQQASRNPTKTNLTTPWEL
jgi:hypothetical protein